MRAYIHKVARRKQALIECLLNKFNIKADLLTYFLTYLLTPSSRVLLEKLTSSAASQEIPRLFGTRRFLTVPTSARYLSKTLSLFLLRDTSSRNTPPGDPSGGVVYLRIVLSPEEASRLPGISKHGFSRGGVVSTSANPQAGGPPLVGCPRLLIQFIRSYPPYRRPFLHPQPEDAPCSGDRDPPDMVLKQTICLKYK